MITKVNKLMYIFINKTFYERTVHILTEQIFLQI